MQLSKDTISATDSRAHEGGRNIVLLSDGTGNSAAKLNKTNVWRLYNSLDLSDGNQLAFYDDGVGTSGSKLMTLLGGAFGRGLARNVRDLYRSLCEHYRPPDESYPGDRIYILGFSRGAFTARILADLVTSCGILDLRRDFKTGETGLSLGTKEGLDKAVMMAWKAYRRKYKAPLLARVVRPIRDVLATPVPGVGEFREAYSFRDPEPIEALAVWDTVSAYGLPFDELSTLVDKLVYKLKFDDHRLNPKVKRAFHALALDDERQSFHPLLWDEGRESNLARIQQVWFAGMHSDVGGGYADGRLSLVSLKWMMNRLGELPDGAALRFQGHSSTTPGSTPAGTIHDSRSGLATAYRYKPRMVEDFCEDNLHKVHVSKAKIHSSVLLRLADGTGSYAPTGLPRCFDVVDNDGGTQDSRSVEDENETDRRMALQERIRTFVFRRRTNHFVMLLSVLGLLVLPLYRPPTPGLVVEGFQKFPAIIFERLDFLLPDILLSWTDAWIQSPYVFISLVVVLLLGYWHGGHLSRCIHRLSEVGWWHGRGRAESRPEVPHASALERLEAWCQHQPLLRTPYRYLVRYVAPFTVLLLVALFAALAGYRILVHGPMVRNGICARSDTANTPHSISRSEVEFDTRSTCLNTGIDLVAGKRYTIHVDQRTPWKDGKRAATQAGLSSWRNRLHWIYFIGLGDRRHLGVPWFMLVGEIGRDSGFILPLRSPAVTFEATRSGRLYLYVNDAVNSLSLPVPASKPGGETSTAWDAFYRQNNEGTAIVTVTPTG